LLGIWNRGAALIILVQNEITLKRDSKDGTQSGGTGRPLSVPNPGTN